MGANLDSVGSYTIHEIHPMPTSEPLRPIAPVWKGLMANSSVLIPIMILLTIQNQREAPIPAWLWALGLLAGACLMSLAFKRLGTWAEAHGWIYFRPAKRRGLGAGTLLDLDILWGTPKNQVEQVRMAREAMAEGRQQNGEGGDPSVTGRTSRPGLPASKTSQR